MRFHCDFADAKLEADLFIQQAGNDECHHLPLATAEQGVTVSQPTYLHLMVKRSPTALDRLLDSAQQRVVAKWLGKEVEGPRLHGLNRYRNVAMIRDEDHRHVFPIDCETLLQIKAIEIRKRNVNSGLERVQRTAADVAKDKTEAFFIHRFARPVIWRAAPGSTPVDLLHEPGDFCISSTEWRFDAESKGPALFDMLVIPQAALSPLLMGGRMARPFRLPGASPLGSLLGVAMDAAKAQAPLLADELGEAVLRTLCGLVTLACGASDDGTEWGRDSLRSAQLAAVKRHVDLHLADPHLSPASAAAALGISARQLHRLFEPSGSTFARYVLAQRLLRCRDTIAGATGTERSVVDIAFGWGFNSMATFYRAFVSEFGSPPGALRAASRKDA